MGVRLTVKQRSEEGGADKAAEVILEEDTITLGRDTTCQVVLAQQAVSRTHARISRDGHLFFVEDLGSSYGTKINGKALPKGEKRLLKNGDVIAIAQFDVTFDRITEVPKASENATGFVGRQLVKDVMKGLTNGGGESAYLRVMSGPKEGQRIPIQDAQELIVGRDEEADIVLKDDLVSRKHAKFRRDWSGTHVEDLESRNGIKVNRKRVTRKTLHDRDEVEIGGVKLLYVDPNEVHEPPVVLADELKATPEASGDQDPEEATKHQPVPELKAKPKAPPPEPAPPEKAPPPKDAKPAAAPAKPEPAPPPEPPKAAKPEPAPSEADANGAPEGGEPDEEEAPPEPVNLLSSKRHLAILAGMGVMALLALVLVILIIVGA